MTWQTFWLYLTTVTLVSATPGPNMLLVMRSGIHHGLGRSFFTMAGCMTSLVAMMCVSAAGLGALLATSETLFTALRYGGAAYLIYLGIQCWRAPAATWHANGEGSSAIPPAPIQLFREGVLVAASNPKAILFFTALFPQFIDPQSPQTLQWVILSSCFCAVEFLWQLVYASSGVKISPWLQQPRWVKRFNQGSGAVFIGFGVLLSLARKP